jgi:hypothetical protein
VVALVERESIGVLVKSGATHDPGEIAALLPPARTFEPAFQV